jgi:alanine racemase
LRVFEEVRRVLARQGTLPEFVHAANSAATLDLPESWLEGVRVGLAAYGISPLPPEVPAPMPLRPALSWRARVAQVKDLPAGAAVGYGGTFTCPAPMRVAAATIGYADGYPRALSNRASVLIRGARCPVLGRVSMDLITVDCATVPEAEPGDIVTLLGRDGDDEISAWELAVRAGTIPYEITCGLSPRVPRTYPE